METMKLSKREEKRGEWVKEQLLILPQETKIKIKDSDAEIAWQIISANYPQTKTEKKVITVVGKTFIYGLIATSALMMVIIKEEGSDFRNNNNLLTIAPIMAWLLGTSTLIFISMYLEVKSFENKQALFYALRA